MHRSIIYIYNLLLFSTNVPPFLRFHSDTNAAVVCNPTVPPLFGIS